MKYERSKIPGRVGFSLPGFGRGTTNLGGVGVPCGRYNQPPDFERLARQAVEQLDFSTARPEGDDPPPRVDLFIYRPVAEHEPLIKPEHRNHQAFQQVALPKPRKRKKTQNEHLSKWGFRELPAKRKKIDIPYVEQWDL
jgi:hypothetical protein